MCTGTGWPAHERQWICIESGRPCFWHFWVTAALVCRVSPTSNVLFRSARPPATLQLRATKLCKQGKSVILCSEAYGTKGKLFWDGNAIHPELLLPPIFDFQRGRRVSNQLVRTCCRSEYCNGQRGWDPRAFILSVNSRLLCSTKDCLPWSGMLLGVDGWMFQKRCFAWLCALSCRGACLPICLGCSVHIYWVHSCAIVATEVALGVNWVSSNLSLHICLVVCCVWLVHSSTVKWATAAWCFRQLQPRPDSVESLEDKEACFRKTTFPQNA